MSDLEFTGERVIPGLVDNNLFNEHFARYRFAAGFAKGKRVLDAGCGTGYGAAELAREAAFVAAIDFSFEALDHARSHYPGPLHVQARCEALPFADHSFDVVTAFEVIEHLTEWDKLLAEARRTLREDGLFLVSTPNKQYYAETRQEAGPNPYHAHEFDYAEFAAALRRHFPEVQIWLQNHTEGITFAPGGNATGVLETNEAAAAEDAHFYLALCSGGTLPAAVPFAWIPNTANVLRTREHHIGLLQREIEQKTVWLKKFERELFGLQQEHEAVLVELRTANDWAAQRSGELEAAKTWGQGLEQRLAEARGVVAARDAELASRNEWVAHLTGQLAERESNIADWKQAYARLEVEFHAAQHSAAGVIDALNGEIAAVRGQYAAAIDALEKETLETAASYHAEVSRLESEIVGLHEGYQAGMASLREELGKVATGYETEVGRLQGELAEVHRVYQAVVESLEEQVGTLESERDEIVKDRGRILRMLNEAAASKWLKLGRGIGLGPKLELPQQ